MLVSKRLASLLLNSDARLPVRIAIVLLDEDVDRGKGVVIHLAEQSRGWTFHHNVLVDFVVAAIGFYIGQFFVAAQRMAEQAQIPIRVIGVFQPATQKEK